MTPRYSLVQVIAEWQWSNPFFQPDMFQSVMCALFGGRSLPSESSIRACSHQAKAPGMNSVVNAFPCGGGVATGFANLYGIDIDSGCLRGPGLTLR